MTTSEPSMAGNSGERSVCRVVILHESDDALDRVNKLCDHLMSQHWLEVELEFDRWSFSALLEPGVADQAHQAAIQAQIVVVSAAAGQDFSENFKAWAERWAASRAGREGALVGMLAAAGGVQATGCARDILLHRMALRAGMDYLAHLPGAPMRTIPNLGDWCAARASTVTDTLSEILRSQPRWHPD